MARESESRYRIDFPDSRFPGAWAVDRPIPKSSLESRGANNRIHREKQPEAPVFAIFLYGASPVESTRLFPPSAAEHLSRLVFSNSIQVCSKCIKRHAV